MKSFPIMFSAPMIHAHIERRKWQTRRLTSSPLAKSEPGDLLWFRENHAFGNRDPKFMLCEADWKSTFRRLSGFDATARPKWKPSIHMPRRFSRFTAIVREKRFQRIHDISAEDCIAEGIKAITKDGNLIKYGIPDSDGLPGTVDYGWPWSEWETDPREAYKKLWIKLHGQKSWDSNPDVVAISYHPMPINIDNFLALYASITCAASALPAEVTS